MWRKVNLSLVFLIVFSCVVGAVTYLYADENFLKNPGFERKDGWNVFGNESWTRNLNSTEEKHSGSQSFKVVIKKAKPWDSVIAEQVVKDVTEGDDLEASVWVNVPEDTPLVDTFVYLELFFIAEDSSDLGRLRSIKYNNQTVPRWEKLFISGIIPKGTKSVKFWLVVAPQGDSTNAGTVYFDDACLEIFYERPI